MTGSSTGPRAASLSTHVLDSSVGRPATGVPVELSVRDGATGEWRVLAGSVTDSDGRVRDLPEVADAPATCRLRFAVAEYHRSRGTERVLFPEVDVVLVVSPGEHHHVPLLLNPFSYSVYRGS